MTRLKRNNDIGCFNISIQVTSPLEFQCLRDSWNISYSGQEDSLSNYIALPPLWSQLVCLTRSEAGTISWAADRIWRTATEGGWSHLRYNTGVKQVRVSLHTFFTARGNDLDWSPFYCFLTSVKTTSQDDQLLGNCNQSAACMEGWPH